MRQSVEETKGFVETWDLLSLVWGHSLQRRNALISSNVRGQSLQRKNALISSNVEGENGNGAELFSVAPVNTV